MEKNSDLKIKGIEKVINENGGKDFDFIGLEDPDLFIEKNDMVLYFTIAYKFKNKSGFKVLLGKASGKSLNEMKAEDPVLIPVKENGNLKSFKELSFLSKEKKIALVESGCGLEETKIESFEIQDNGKWKHLATVAEPKKLGIDWASAGLSTGLVFNQSFIKKENLFVGLLNGREKAKKNGKYGRFRIGLILFNKRGKIKWISKKPFIEDPKAKSITFASCFIQKNKNIGFLYAHVDDSFIRVYEIKSNELKRFLPKKIAY